MSKSAYYLCASDTVPSATSVRGTVNRINWVNRLSSDTCSSCPFVLCLYYKQQRLPQQWEGIVRQNGWKPYNSPQAMQHIQSKTRGRHAIENLRGNMFDDHFIDEWLANGVMIEAYGGSDVAGSDMTVVCRSNSSAMVSQGTVQNTRPPQQRYGQDAIIALSALASRTADPPEYESDVQVAMAKLDFMVRAADVLMSNLSNVPQSSSTHAVNKQKTKQGVVSSYDALEDAAYVLSKISETPLGAKSSLRDIVNQCKQSIMTLGELKQRLSRDADMAKSKYISVPVNNMIASTCNVAVVRIHACIVQQLTQTKETMTIMPDVLAYLSVVYAIRRNTHPKVSAVVAAVMTREQPTMQTHSLNASIAMSQAMMFQYFLAKLERLEAAHRLRVQIASLQSPIPEEVDPMQSEIDLRATRMMIEEACLNLCTQAFVQLVCVVFKPMMKLKLETSLDAIVNLGSKPNIVPLYKFLIQVTQLFAAPAAVANQHDRTIRKWVCCALRQHADRVRLTTFN